MVVALKSRCVLADRSAIIDPDALAFFERASVTDSAGRAQVHSFIRGMKALGEWGSVYNAWTLRNYQAGGLSSTLYGLKPGNDGTLTNGPTWGADGILFDRSNDRIEIANAAGAFRNQGQGYMVAVFQRTNTNESGQFVFMISTAGTINQSRAVLQGQNNSISARRLDGDSTVSSTGSGDQLIHYSEGRLNWSGGDVQSVTDGVANSPVNFAAAGNTSDTDSLYVGIGGGGSSNYFGGVVSFCLLMRSIPSEAKAEQIRALYKSTLGLGLGLP